MKSDKVCSPRLLREHTRIPFKMDGRRIEIYTDGACKGNPGPGGWGVVVLENTEKNHNEIYHAFGGEIETTNNRMEITAILFTVKALTKRTDKFWDELVGMCQEIVIYSDSMLCLQTIAAKPSSDVTYFLDKEPDGWMRGWKKNGWKGKKNVDLWQKVDKYLRLFLAGGKEPIPKIGFRYVKGHSSNPGNDLADKYANEGVVYEV